MLGLASYYLGLGQNGSKTKEGPEPIRALPASWYTSEDMYELERRAIFSKKWMLVTHKSRLPNAGDWLKFEIAGYEFVICRDRKGDVNGFHNVCRHRAFPVVQGGDQGTAKIFSCQYHGWSYGLDGKLAKAPKYDELTGFDKSQNGLFRIHVKVDQVGFVWVNLDGSDTPEPWENDFAHIDAQERYSVYNFDDYELHTEEKLPGDYNWKILADNFNECYHCPTTHPDIPELADIETHDVKTDHAWIQHQSTPTEDQKKKGMAIASTYFFPNVSISVLPHFIMLQRFLPQGPKRSAMHYQFFKNKNSTEEDYQRIYKLYRKVVGEDKALCEQAQKNLNTGIFVNGQLHPRLEKGPLFFQKVNRDVIQAHLKLEKAAKRQIWPARQVLPSAAGSLVSNEDEEICSGLACQTNKEGMVW